MNNRYVIPAPSTLFAVGRTLERVREQKIMTTETRAIRSLLLAAVGSLLLAVNAQATLVSLDLSTTGDGRLTLDTLTGLEWLDLTATTNQSLSNLTPEQVYKSGQGGGALIIDKFNKQGDGERNR